MANDRQRWGGRADVNMAQAAFLIRLERLFVRDPRRPRHRAGTVRLGAKDDFVGHLVVSLAKADGHHATGAKVKRQDDDPFASLASLVEKFFAGQLPASSFDKVA